MTDWPFGALMPLRYGAILADPPWSYTMRSPRGHAKSPEAHYATMSIEEIAALPVGRLAGPSCLLFLWSTWPHLPQALEVMRAWGFRYVTGGAWAKRTAAGRLTFGTGYVLRSSSEPFLVGALGAPGVASRAERNVIEPEDPGDIPDRIDALRREHSRKPPEMRAMVERLRPDQWCCELFAREPWPGHDVWGNETDRFGGAG